jgi:hypothetical protein
MSSQNISFEYSCSQKWGDLDNAAIRGQKFCQQCKTPVHNLAEKSHEEIIELIKQSNNHLCGYFHEEQLAPSQEPKSSFHPKLIIASVAAWLTFNAPKAMAQQSKIIVTEQHDSASVNGDEHKYGVVDGNPVCFIDETPAVTTPKKWKRHSITLFYLGRKRVYLSKRFPFLHVRRAVAGFLRY